MKTVKPIPPAIMLSLFLAAFALASGPASTIELPLACPLERPESLAGNALTYGGRSFQSPEKAPTFRELYELSTSYKVKEESSFGGALRFVIGIDTDGDGRVDRHVIAHIDTTDDCGCTDGLVLGKNLHLAAYAGPTPSLSDRSGGPWVSTGNLIHSTQPGFEIAESVSQPPASNMSYDDVLFSLGDLADRPVLYVILIGDDGSGDDHNQNILVDNVKVNNFKQTVKQSSEIKQ